MIEPYRIDVPAAVLDDLRERLLRTRFPNEIEGVGWDQGPPLGYLRDIVAYWLDGYDWRAAEARLNEFDHRVTDVDGQRIHFMCVESPHAGALPLVLVHGWPGSIVEFLDVIGPLTDPSDPADAFSLVIPSLPGYGFSGPTSEPGWTPRRIARAFGSIMADLGHGVFGVQGGDWGSIVVCHMADLFPERVCGLHVNFLHLPPRPGDAPPAMSDSRLRFLTTGAGYSQIQGTKPQTIGYLLDDSPAGLAAWILEKFREWSDCGGDPERSFTKDQLLTNVMMYWLTGTGASSGRLYWEMRQLGAAGMPEARVDVPTGVAIFPAEALPPDRKIAEQRFNVVHWTEHEHGGHFAAMEVPDLLVADVRQFFRRVR